MRSSGRGGDLDEVRPWASVSKMAVALAFGVEVDWELHRLDDRASDRAVRPSPNLLSHSSGLGLEEDDPVGRRRRPSASTRTTASTSPSQAILGENSAEKWLADRVFTPFGMSTRRASRVAPSSGVVGSTERPALDWRWRGFARTRISTATRDRVITPYVPQLDGIVPGFGRFSPVSVGTRSRDSGEKHHWMGDWPAASFGHFGQSGVADAARTSTSRSGVVATSTEAVRTVGGHAVARLDERDASIGACFVSSTTHFESVSTSTGRWSRWATR